MVNYDTVDHIIDWFREHSIVDSYSIDMAIYENNLMIVKFLHHHPRGYSTEAMNTAVDLGYRKIVEYLLEKGYAVDDYDVDTAADNGHLEIMKLIWRPGCFSTSIDLAAQNGHNEIVQFIHDNRSPGEEYFYQELVRRLSQLIDK